LIRGRGMGYIREVSPLFDSPFSTSLLQGEGEVRILKGQSPFKLPLVNEFVLV